MESRESQGGSGRRGNSGESQQQNYKGNSQSSRGHRRDRRRRWSDIRHNNRGQGYNRFRGTGRQITNSEDRHHDQGPGHANSFQKFRDTHNPYLPIQMGAVNEKAAVEHRSNYPIEPLIPNIIENIALNTYTQASTEKNKPAVSNSTSSSSSDSEGSEDSAVRSLRREVDKTLQPNNPPMKETNHSEVKDKLKEKPAEGKQISIKSEVPKEQRTKDSVLEVKKEQTSKSDKSSSSSTSSSSDSSSEESEPENNKNPSSVEDVICLGNLEKFEDLVADEELPGKAVCALCDKSGHISFHCQMICKNCNGKYHGLKDCPKPANLAIVFSNFLQFCLKQSWKYNPNAEFAVDEVTGKANLRADTIRGERNKRRSRTPKSTRKRHKSTTSNSSDSNSESTPTKRKKRRSKKSDGIQTPLSIPFTVPFQPAFNSFGMGPSGSVNPLLAFSHMMGYNPTSLDFRGNMLGKDQH